MPHPIPYLGFNGNCAEAMRFYESALDGKLEMLMSGADSPIGGADSEGGLPIEFCMRGSPRKTAGTLYAGDAPTEAPYQGIHGVSDVFLQYDTASEAHKVFEKLSAGGKVMMPMAPTFWAKSFGMLIDRFGTPWMVNGEMQH